MPKPKSKRYGSRGFTVDLNPAALAEEFRKNERLVQRVLAERRKRGQKFDHNGYIPLKEDVR